MHVKAADRNVLFGHGLALAYIMRLIVSVPTEQSLDSL